MKKIQSFYTLKFSSSRLREANYKIDNLSLDQARQNQEVVRTSDSELLRAIRRIREIDFNQSELDTLLRRKKRGKASYELNKKIDDILFVKDIVTVEFDDSRHYSTMMAKGGVWVNGKKYTRLLVGAGMARRSTIMLCNEEIIDDIRNFLNCGRSENYELVPSKYSAYLALASTSSWRVSEPNFVVIPDYVVKREIEVDFLHESDSLGRDPLIYPEKKILDFNMFDGQGLISPRMAEKWAKDIDADYLPAEFIFRSAFFKGLLITFDYHALAEKNNINVIKDIYGKEHNIDDVDIIASESQFKLWQAYADIDDYRSKCKEHDFSWSVSRCSPKKDKDFCFSTYQYLQNLNITSKDQIESLCKKTVSWFENVTGEDWTSTILFLLGEVNKSRISSDWFDKLDNSLLQCLILEPNLIYDKQIQGKVSKLINKKIRESYLGVLLLNGNYEFIFIDPLAQAEWGLGLQVKGILPEGKSYSKYWLDQNKNVVSAIRSPMTYYSENNLLQLVNTEDTQYWYKYLNTGIIFNAFGTDMMRMSGADSDGDACLTTDQKEFIDCAYKNVLPPSYERKNAEKKHIVENDLWKYDIKTFKSKIGLITNIGTQLFATLPLFDKKSSEYEAISNRLKICNCFQSMEIDRAKGIKTMDIPRYWTKWDKIDDADTEEEQRYKKINQEIIADRRPYFFRYLYPEYDKNNKKRISAYDKYSMMNFKLTLQELIFKSDRTEKEEKTFSNFCKFGELLDSDCVMNNICHYMESKIKEIKANNKLKNFDFKEIINSASEFKDKNRLVIQNIYHKYKDYKKDVNYHSSTNGFHEMMMWLRNQAEPIVTSPEEIVYWGSEFGASFLIDVFPLALIHVLKENCNHEILLPVFCDDGYAKYMNKKYEILRITI